MHIFPMCYQKCSLFIVIYDYIMDNHLYFLQEKVTGENGIILERRSNGIKNVLAEF